MSTADRVFLDTNILVYGQLRECGLFETVERRLAELEKSGNELWISRQILREYLSAMTRGKGVTAVPPMQELLADVR